MDPARTYLKKHATGDPLVAQEAVKGLKYIVILPAYLETRLEESLVSLYNTISPKFPVEILVVINWPEDEIAENVALSHQIFKSASLWANGHSTDNKHFHVAEVGYIPRKKAGVGFARKTGMDEAVRRFLQAGQSDGILISFDADTLCDTNYFQEIEEHFHTNPYINGCSIYFEHPLEGNTFSKEVYKAITQYELHMRCYLHGIRQSGFPNAFYTVGSALAVRASSYCMQGGMNIRQAGEDFYFLQKFFDLGNFSDLTTTRVCPSPRPSLRVPFGTGKTIDQLLTSGESLKSFHPSIYVILGEFFACIPLIYKQITETRKFELPVFQDGLNEFLAVSGFQNDIMDIYTNSGSYPAFIKRFYRYFNMFKILKFVKYFRKYFPDLPVDECARSILKKAGAGFTNEMDEKQLLLEFRKCDKSSIVQQ